MSYTSKSLLGEGRKVPISAARRKTLDKWVETVETRGSPLTNEELARLVKSLKPWNERMIQVGGLNHTYMWS